ncbi:MAG TPA: GrpB family protein [Pyrinomonadaceae bacterium]|nr:GrpB family protein [Pyrinomonadaceae bacterium]
MGTQPIRRSDSGDPVIYETVVYEVHVKGFTQQHPNVPENLRGLPRHPAVAYLFLVRPRAMNDVLLGGVEKRKIFVVDYDPFWPEKFQEHAAILSQALGSKALSIEHVGSTSVPGLAAKPIIDVIVLVEDSGDEPAYLPSLLEAGYVLRIREPHWDQHRMVRTPELDVHVHIFSTGCIEVTRQLAFRDHLRRNAEDRLFYQSVKRRLAKEDWPDMDAYARAKTEVVEQITARALLGVANGANQSLEESES